MNANKRNPYSVKDVILVAIFASLTAVGGMIRIPLLFVPITFQTLFVYLAGSVLGRSRGAVSQVVFLSVGLAGLPIFAMGGGPGYVLQPSFGYLLGFPIAAWIVGTLLNRSDRPLYTGTLLMSFLAGLGAIHGLGVSYLYVNVNYLLHREISLAQAIWSGSILFLPGEILKLGLAVILSQRLRTVVQR